MGSAPGTPETVDTLFSEVEKAEGTAAELQKLKDSCKKLNASEQQALAEKLRALKVSVETERTGKIDTELAKLDARLKIVDELIAHLTPPPPVAPPEKPADKSDATKKTDIVSKGQELGETAGAAAGSVVGGGVEGAVNLVKREWGMITDPNMHFSDKALRYTGIAAAGVGLFYLLRRIVRGAKDAETGKRKGGVLRGILYALGITAVAGVGLNAIRPWAEKQMAKEAVWRERAEGKIAASKTPTPEPEITPAIAEIAKQLPEGTDLKATEHEITIKGKKTKFQITDRGIMLNGNKYEVGTDTPITWVRTIDKTLAPNITEAKWTAQGIAIKATVKLQKRHLWGENTVETEQHEATIPFDAMPAFFAQAEAGQSFVYKHTIPIAGGISTSKDFQFEKMKPATA